MQLIQAGRRAIVPVMAAAALVVAVVAPVVALDGDDGEDRPGTVEVISGDGRIGFGLGRCGVEFGQRVRHLRAERRAIRVDGRVRAGVRRPLARPRRARRVRDQLDAPDRRSDRLRGYRGALRRGQALGERATARSALSPASRARSATSRSGATTPPTTTMPPWPRQSPRTTTSRLERHGPAPAMPCRRRSSRRTPVLASRPRRSARCSSPARRRRWGGPFPHRRRPAPRRASR